MDNKKNIGQKSERNIFSSHEIMDCKRVFNRKYAPAPDVNKEWEMFCEEHKIHSNRRREIRMWVTFVSGMAAAIILLLGIPRLLNEFKSSRSMQVFSAVNNGDKVILSSGKGRAYVISGRTANKTLLAGGVKANCDSLVCNGTMTGRALEWMTLTTPRGKDYRVTLPDGTKVLLNAGSKLVFPKCFSANKRIVKLQGEAYFEVVHDEHHPFEVENRFFTTSVWGTEFNVRAYSASDAYVVLIRGRVSLQSKEHPQSQIMSPGEKAQWMGQKGFAISDVDTYAYVQWKEGYFYFNNVPLVEIMQELGRWYNVDVIFENSKNIHTRLHFVANRNQDLNFALDNLNTLEVVHARLDHNKIFIQ